MLSLYRIFIKKNSQNHFYLMKKKCHLSLGVSLSYFLPWKFVYNQCFQYQYNTTTTFPVTLLTYQKKERFFTVWRPMRIGITTILTTSDGSDTKLKFAGFLECGRGTSLLWPNRIQPIFTQKKPVKFGYHLPHHY